MNDRYLFEAKRKSWKELHKEVRNNYTISDSGDMEEYINKKELLDFLKYRKKGAPETSKVFIYIDIINFVKYRKTITSLDIIEKFMDENDPGNFADYWYNKGRSEGVKEFSEKVKKELSENIAQTYLLCAVKTSIDKILKEMGHE